MENTLILLFYLFSGVYDKDAPDEVLISSPHLYRTGRLGKIYKTYSFWLTMLDALYQSTCIFFICQQVYNDTYVDVYEFGTTATTACMFAMLLHAAIEMRSWVSLKFCQRKRYSLLHYYFI